jgi:hypothetical protein
MLVVGREVPRLAERWSDHRAAACSVGSTGSGLTRAPKLVPAIGVGPATALTATAVTGGLRIRARINADYG